MELYLILEVKLKGSAKEPSGHSFALLLLFEHINGILKFILAKLTPALSGDLAPKYNFCNMKLLMKDVLNYGDLY